MNNHICFLTPSLELGGAERSLVKMANTYTVLGQKVTIISFSSKPGLQKLLNKKITLYSLPNLSASNPILWIQIFLYLRKVKPNIIFGWSLYGNLVAALLAINIKTSKLILSERNYLPCMINKQKRHVNLRSCLSLFTIRRLYHHAHVITANSQQSIRFLKKYIGSKPAYLHLPNMINLNEIDIAMNQPMPPPTPVTDLKILAVGRLWHQKGFDILLEAMQEIFKIHPTWSLLIVGDGPEKQQLLTLSEKLNLTQNIHWAGAQINPFPYYKWADLVIVPSRFEGFPNVPLEAMACGTPVICSDCKTGPRELTCGGKFGILVPVKNPQLLAHEIISIGEDKSFQKILGENARNHIKNTYTDQVVQIQMLKLLTRVNRK